MHLEKNYYRLAKVANLLNIGSDTIVSFLKSIGVEINDYPNSKISKEHFTLIRDHFKIDFEIKEQHNNSYHFEDLGIEDGEAYDHFFEEDEPFLFCCNCGLIYSQEDDTDRQLCIASPNLNSSFYRHDGSHNSRLLAGKWVCEWCDEKPSFKATKCSNLKGGSLYGNHRFIQKLK